MRGFGEFKSETDKKGGSKLPGKIVTDFGFSVNRLSL
jgi:hypothetical protein